MQTQGKTYLARRGNLEKHLAPELLELFSQDLAAFENPQALVPPIFTKPPITRETLIQESIDPSLPTGLWIHEEDLCVETSALGHQSFEQVAVTADVDS